MPSAQTSRPTRLIYATSTLAADLFYVTGFFAPDPFLFLEQNGKRIVMLSDLELDRGRKEARADEIVPLSSIQKPLEKKLKKKPTHEETVVAFLRKRRIRRAKVPADFPFGLATALAQEGVELSPIEGPFWPEREYKQKAEIEALERAIRLTEVGLARAEEVLRSAEIRPGKRLVWGGQKLTSEILRAEIDCAILRAGGAPTDTIVAGGDQACDPHDRGSGELKANSLIIIDVFPRDPHSGYYGDLTRTYVRGKASPAQKRLWETVRAGQEHALSTMKPDAVGKEIEDGVKQRFTDAGYPTEQKDGRWTGFFHGLGHGLGLDIHESPRIAAAVLKPNQVFTVEPGLYYPGLGGVRIEDDGVVTDSGFRVLSKFPKVLEL
jgi:Xaa-Pro aminopeptidase